MPKSDVQELQYDLPEVRLKFISTLTQIYEHFLDEGMMHPETFVYLMDLLASTKHDATQPLQDWIYWQ